MFLTSAMVSPAGKVLIVVTAVLLTYFNVIDTDRSLISCHDPQIAEAKVNASRDQTWILELCSLNDTSKPCLEFGSNKTRLSQKIRVCSSPEIENGVWTGVVLVVLLSTIASAMAAYNLHQISDYYEF